MKWLLFFFAVLLFSSDSNAQKAGSVEAYRIQYDQQMALIKAQSDWKSAKKLCRFFDPIDKFEEAVQDFSSIEIPEAGIIGYIQAWPFKVISVVDKTNAILSVGDAVLWMEEFETSGLADGEFVRVLDPIKFTATKQYVTASGASRTVKAFKMIDKPELEKHKAKQAEDTAKQAKEKRKVVSKTFGLADGKSIDAIFVDIRKGKVVMEGLDGETIEHVLSDFDAKSASVIRELFKNKPKDPLKKPTQK